MTGKTTGEMSLRTKSSFQQVCDVLWSYTTSAKYFGILLGLVAVGYLGHHNHWSFGNTKHAATDGSHESREVATNASVSASNVETTSEGWEIHFPSENSLHRSGITTSPVKRRSISEQVKTTGVITYNERMSATLSARASGTVWRVLKHAGDAVAKGDVLVIIDAAEVGRAKAEFFSDLVDVESKTDILAARQSIPEVIPQRQIREAHVALREARIRLQNTEQALVNLGFRLRKESFEKLSDSERAAKLQFLGLPDSIVKSLDHEQVSSNLLALTASFDGVLIHNDAATGEMVEAGKPILEIADLRRMWLKLDVPKEDASKLALGQRVRFRPDGVEQELESTISWISTEMNEQTRTLQIRAEVENPVVSSTPDTGHEVRMLRAQTFGRGTITLGEATSAFVVPTTAVAHADHQPLIFVQSGDLTFRRVDVKLGLREGQVVQVESDELTNGMEVVNRGSHVLKSEWILNHVASAGP